MFSGWFFITNSNLSFTLDTYNSFDAASPFGGVKQSGFGRELGVHALELYTQVKSVWINLGD